MPFSPRNRGHTPFIVLAALVVGVVLILFRGSLFGLVGGILSASPQGSEYQLLPKNIIASRLASAEEELTRIRYQAILYEEVASENARLKEILKVPEDERSSVGRVVSRPPQTLYDTLLVATGPGAAVHVGDRALFSGALVGTVTRVSGTTIQVSLLSSPGVETDVRVGTPTAIVVMRGVGGGAFEFDLSDSVSVAVGDLIMTGSGTARPVAIVGSIKSGEESVVAHIMAYQIVSLADIDFVEFVSP